MWLDDCEEVACFVDRLSAPLRFRDPYPKGDRSGIARYSTILFSETQSTPQDRTGEALRIRGLAFVCESAHHL